MGDGQGEGSVLYVTEGGGGVQTGLVDKDTASRDVGLPAYVLLR